MRRSGALNLAAGVAAAALVTACVSPGGTARLQTDLDSLQKQVWSLQKDQAVLAQQVGAAGARPETGTDPALAEIRMRLDSLARDLDALRTRADETDQRLNGVADQVRAARQALDMTARMPIAAAAVPAAGVPAPGTAEGAGGDDLYRLGYGDFGRGNYDKALAELQDFVRLNPADGLADDAQYLIGEVYFTQQKYPEAVAAYERLLQEHGAGDKAPGAYLKKGLALLEMNRTADAVIQLQHVISAYPKSEEARIARERLRALGLRER